MKRIKYVFFLFLIIAICFFIHTCEKDFCPVASENETPYGTVAQIDDYPLYKIEYTSDYKFDQYLVTGNIPFYTSITSKSKNYCCSCFAAFGEETRLLGRNYDWLTHSSYFIVFTHPSDAYSSISTVDMYFFDYSHDQPPDFEENIPILRTLPYYPFDGINEKGVAVGMNAIDHAEPPYDPAKTTIGELQLIRLILDYAASIREAIDLINQYNIHMENPPIHYLIADSSGQSVVVEFIDGELEIMENTNPWQVTTNFIISGLDGYENAPCSRYKNACETLYSNNGILSENDAVELLQTISVSTTRWSTVFNLKTGQLQIVMGRKFNDPHSFSIHK